MSVLTYAAQAPAAVRATNSENPTYYGKKLRHQRKKHVAAIVARQDTNLLIFWR